MSEDPRYVPAPIALAWQDALVRRLEHDSNNKQLWFCSELLGDVLRDANNDPHFDWQKGRVNFAVDREMRPGKYNPDKFIATLVQETGISTSVEDE